MNPSGLCLHICTWQHPGHSTDPPTCKSLKGQWVQTPLLASEWISECSPKGWVPGRETLVSLGEGIHGPP